MRQEDQLQTSFCVLKSFILGKSKWSTAHFQYIPISLNLKNYKDKLQKTLDY